MQQHITILGILYIALSLLAVLAACIVFVVLFSGGLISGEEEAIAATSIVGSGIAGFLILISAPGIIGGWGLLKYKNWARILIIVLAAFNLLNFPLGTALALYTFWVMLQDETARLFASR